MSRQGDLLQCGIRSASSSKETEAVPMLVFLSPESIRLNDEVERTVYSRLRGCYEKHFLSRCCLRLLRFSARALVPKSTAGMR